MPLILLRHPQPDVAPGICYGASDLALLRDPASDAVRLACDLPPVDRIVTSPLGRCRALADALAECLGLPATIDATTPASAAASMESGNGKKASDAKIEPSARSPALSMAISTLSTRLI